MLPLLNTVLAIFFFGARVGVLFAILYLLIDFWQILDIHSIMGILILSQYTLHQLSSHCNIIALMDFWCLCIHKGAHDSKQLTIASRCSPTPKFVGCAGYSAGSISGVPWVTGVGYWWLKGCTRATSFTMCRSMGSCTTADSCRDGTGIISL